MWRKEKYITASKRKQIYSAYVHSYLTYMMPIYSECAAYKLKELQTLQNRCIKATYRLERLTSSTYLYSTGLLPVQELVKVERAVYIHKLFHSLAKHNFELVTNSSVHSRSTRRDSHIHVFNHRSNSSMANEVKRQLTNIMHLRAKYDTSHAFVISKTELK